MRRALTELRKAYRKGANIVLNPLSAPVQERAQPVRGDLKLAAKIYSTRDLEDLLKHISRKGGVSSLSLRDNAFTPDHAEILARYLEETGVKDLDLGLNQLGDEGVKVLVRGASNLRNLDLSFNEIGLSGSEAVLELMRDSRNMRVLCLGGNDVTGKEPDRFYRSLSEAISKNNRLQRLSFEPIPVVPSSGDRRKLKEAAQGNPFLEKALFRNRVGDPKTSESWHSQAREASPDYAPEISVQGPRLNLVSDAIKDYSTILLVRMIRKIVADNPSATLDDEDIDYLEKNAQDQTREVLLRDMNGDEIKKFSDFWHTPFRQTQSQKLRDFGNESWQRLLGEKTFAVPVDVAKEKGWELVCLENAQELKEEGSALEHCVGGYADKCLSGRSNIFSVRKDGERRSTIEIAAKGGPAAMIQHYGHKNSKPDKLQQNIATWFVKSINDGTFKFAGVDLERRNNGLVSRLGFDPFDDNKFREVLGTFRDSILPSGKFEISLLTRNFNEGLLGKVEFDHGKFEYPRGLELGSTRADDRSPEDNLKVKVREAIQTSMNRIFGKDKSGNSLAKASLIDGRLLIFADKKVSADLKSILGNLVEERPDGLGITGNIKEVRESLTRKAFEMRDAQKLEKQKQRKELRSKDESDLEMPKPTVENPGLGSRDDGGLNRNR